MIGQKLQHIRKQKGYSLRKLAQESGISHSFICDIEHDRSNPSLETLTRLAKVLGVKPSYFLNEIKQDTSA